MTRDEWLLIKRVAAAALDLPEHSRLDYIASACAGDAALRREVESLVRASAKAADLFEGRTWLRTSMPLSVLAPFAHRQFDGFQAGADFHGTERYVIQKRLGAGGMGVVYQVHDRFRDQLVALKTLRRASAADIYRLKREFRSLADIAHPNLVCLYDLTVEEKSCFFTMEFVDGSSLTDYVRRMSSHGTGDASAAVVRATFADVLGGIAELHRHGRLHRDIKPSNIMVTHEGRVVILDFGLTSDVTGGSQENVDGLAGTPDYLAPELHTGGSPSPASDGYALGVTLFQVLAGRLPFEGSLPQIVARKQRGLRPPSSVVADVPGDLDRICAGLLEPDAQRRLTIEDALAQLTGVPGRSAGRNEAGRRSSFVGRAAHLEALSEAMAAVRGGRGRTVCVHGPSGIGKTALVNRFLETFLSGDVVVLRGRCYEHESVPYKALDGVVDSLSAYLRSLPREETAALVAGDAGPLSRVFPVMLQVGTVARAAHAVEQQDPAAQQRLAFLVLRQLLQRLAERRYVVLVVDDLHWADADSIALLQGLLQPPHAPALLTLLCFRAEEIAAKPHLQPFIDARASPAHAILSLEPLNESEAQMLIGSLIASRHLSDETGAVLKRESGGNPFLLEQLALHASANPAPSDRNTTFAGLLDRRFERLPGGSRAFMEALSLCGRPMEAGLVAAAAGLSGDERPLLARLRSEHLVRNSGSAARIEAYHDRIRETLVRGLAPDAVRLRHERLAVTLEARAPDDHEALFEHWRGAGSQHAASRYAVLAAGKADAALAFDRAASFYRSALELTPQAVEIETWKSALAAALTNAGRPEAAATVYLDAAATGGRTQQIELKRRAAEQLLIGGHIDRGMTVIDAVLRELGLRLARGPRSAAVSMLWRRARIRRRGLAFVERTAESVDPDLLLRIDACWSVATGLAMVDSIRAADFNTKHLLLALEAGEPYRVARAIALEAGFLGSSGDRKAYGEWANLAHQLAERLAHPHAQALFSLTAGIASFLFGEWVAGTTHCDRARQLLRDHGAGGTWERTCADVFYLGSLLFRGELREVSRQLPDLLAAARERGNLYVETELRTRMNLVWLAADEPDEGERHADEAMERWSHSGFHRQHYNHTLAHIQTNLYCGRAEDAWRAVSTNWPHLERALLLRIQFLHIESMYLRGRVALLMAARGHDVKRFIAIARGDARRLGAYELPWPKSVSLLLTAGISHLQGDAVAARKTLADAVTSFERGGMYLYAAASRRRLAELGGGGDLMRQANDWMAAQEIRNPARMARLIAPGFSDA